MWSKSSNPRGKVGFDLTLSGRNVAAKERSTTNGLQVVHTTMGRPHQYRYIDIRHLLQGQYAPSWRLEKSREVSPSALKRDPAPVREDLDCINDFLRKSADLHLHHRLMRQSLSTLNIAGASTIGPAGTGGSTLLTVPGAVNNLGMRSSSASNLGMDGVHEILEEEYRALRDLTRNEPRYIGVPSSSSAPEYVNFVQPKPLHPHDELDSFMYGQGENMDDYYNTLEDEDYMEIVPPEEIAMATQPDSSTQNQQRLIIQGSSATNNENADHETSPNTVGPDAIANSGENEKDENGEIENSELMDQKAGEGENHQEPLIEVDHLDVIEKTHQGGGGGISGGGES